MDIDPADEANFKSLVRARAGAAATPGATQIHQASIA